MTNPTCGHILSPLFNLFQPYFTLIQHVLVLLYDNRKFSLMRLYLHFITTRLNKKMGVRKYMN